MLNTLGDFLDRMTAITTRAEEHLRSAAPRGVADLARARAEQARIITSYQLFVHREVFEPLIAGAAPDVVRKVRTLKVECIILAEEFRDFARYWGIDAVVEHWPTYRIAALDFVARIRAHADNVRRTTPDYLSGRRPSLEWRFAG